MKQFSRCKIHKDNETEFLTLNEGQMQLVCFQCLYSKQNDSKNIDLSKIIHLKTIDKDPEGFLYKVYPKMDKKKLDNFLILDHHIKILVKSLREIVSCKIEIEQMIKETQAKIDEAKVIQNQMREKLLKIIQFDTFVLPEVSEEKNQNMNDVVEQKQKEFFQRLEDIKNKLPQIYKSIEEEIPQVQLEYIQKQQESHCFLISKFCSIFNLQYFNNFSNEICKLNCEQSLLDKSYFIHICEQIELRSNKKISSIVKLYQGTKYKLDSVNMGKNIYQESQLLFIFKSKTSNIFGCFYAGCWCKSQIMDDYSLSSFIFSYTLQEIYPLIKENHAGFDINQLSFGFGGFEGFNCDILIERDFQGGYSQLGVNYLAKGKDNTRKSTYLFGDYQPNIVECEVYRIQ